MNKVYIKLPKTGLGNRLLVWAKGIVFAEINALPVVTTSWWDLHWGALTRREKKSRLYLGYFKETSLAKRILIRLELPFQKIIKEPSLIIYEVKHVKKSVFLFNQVITNEDLFFGLRDYQKVITCELYNMLTPKMIKKLEEYSAPVIGVHIRRGDFKLGNQTTPLDYFINAINFIRQTLKEDAPVTLFTDAEDSEVKELLQMPNVLITEKKPDILDILLLSKSQIMVLSKSSTFGYWAAFLSDSLAIRPHYDWQKLIKAKENGSNYVEVKWNEKDEKSTGLLKSEIQKRMFK